MKTMVIQSFRTPVPEWIEVCLASVRQWAANKDFEYRFIDDSIFDVVPAWYMQKVKGKLQVATDYARLVLLHRALQEEGFDQAIWIDADVLVLDTQWQPQFKGTCAFGLEVWIQKDSNGRQLRARTNVHNAVCFFRKNCVVLPFLVHTVESLMKRVDAGHISPQFVGPKLLNALHALAEFELLPEAGALSPLVADDILAGAGEALDLFRNTRQQAPAALNLCASLMPQENAMALVQTLGKQKIWL
jgi:hypothetical protein